MEVPIINDQEYEKLVEVRDVIAAIPDDDAEMWELFDNALGVTANTRTSLIALFAEQRGCTRDEGAAFVAAIATGIVIAERRAQNRG